jgi:hypothetical protein
MIPPATVVLWNIVPAQKAASARPCF